MRAAGVHRRGGALEALDLPSPRDLRPDEILIDVGASGVGNWDEFARTGDWDLGIRPPMALGVEAAGVVAAAGAGVTHIRVGDHVTVHSLPLREQGAWATQHVAAAGHAALVPTGFAVRCRRGGARSRADRRVAEVAANAARNGAADAVRAVRDGGRLATLTADLPAAERDISMQAVQVAPDGKRLTELVGLTRGVLTSFGSRPVAARCGSHGTQAGQARCPRVGDRT